MLSSSITKQDMVALSKLGVPMRYKRGQVIKTKATPGEHMYLIRRGLVGIYNETTSGRGRVHVIYGAGDIFPVAAFSQRVPRGTYAIAETAVTLTKFQYDDFATFMFATKERVAGLLQQIIYQYGIYAFQIENLQLKSSSERLAYRLLFLASRFGKPRTEGIELPRLNRDSIGGSIGIRAETVSREMSNLVQQDIVDYGPGTLTIKNTAALKRLLPDGIEPSMTETRSSGGQSLNAG